MCPAVVAPATDPDELEVSLARPAAVRPRPALAVALLALGLFVGLSRGCTPGSWWAGETDLRGRRRFVPSHRVSDADFRRVRFDRVHRALLPRYLLALQHVHDPRWRPEADASLAALRAAVAPDPNLLALLDELDTLARRDARLNSRRIRWLAWAWSAYLDARGAPYRLEVGVSGVVGRSQVYFRVYRVVRSERVFVAGESFRARWIRRADRTTLADGDLGHTSDADDGALVVADSVRDLAVDHVWPMLDPALDAAGDALVRAHAPRVRAEARGALSPAAFSVLASTAPARRTLAVTARGIDDRAACGSVTRVGTLPLRGFGPDGIASAREWAERSVRDECPELLPEEVDDIARASERLRAARDLEAGVSELLVWVGRAVLAHEVRHAADDRGADGLRTPLRCALCDASGAKLGTSGRAELSAFVASFATEGVGRVAHYQACALAVGNVGPHAEAMRVLRNIPRGADCRSPPDDLYARARGWELALFRRSEPITLPPVRPDRALYP